MERGNNYHHYNEKGGVVVKNLKKGFLLALGWYFGTSVAKGIDSGIIKALKKAGVWNKETNQENDI